MDKYLINPQTGKVIKRWGKTHRRLIRQGIMDIMPEESRVVEEMNKEKPIEEQLAEAKEKMPKEELKRFAIKRGKGIFENHIVKAEKTPPMEDIVEKVSVASVDIYKENAETLDNIEDDDELKQEIRKMLLAKLSG